MSNAIIANLVHLQFASESARKALNNISKFQCYGDHETLQVFTSEKVIYQVTGDLLKRTRYLLRLTHNVLMRSLPDPSGQSL